MSQDMGYDIEYFKNSTPLVNVSKIIQKHENGYVIIEYKALTVAWTQDRTHHFLYGHSIPETNQKFLEKILNCSLVESNQRLQRIITICLPYGFEV